MSFHAPPRDPAADLPPDRGRQGRLGAPGEAAHALLVVRGVWPSDLRDGVLLPRDRPVLSSTFEHFLVLSSSF